VSRCRDAARRGGPRMPSRSGDDGPGTPRAAVRPLLRTRQVREFTPEPPSDEQLDAILEVARWTGSSQNSQPWRFVVPSI